VNPLTAEDIISRDVNISDTCEIEDILVFLDFHLPPFKEKEAPRMPIVTLATGSSLAPANPYVNPYAFPVDRNVSQKRADPAISEKQLRALTKKHLLLMLRDSEKELVQAKELLATYQAIFEHWQGIEGSRLYE